MGAGEKREWETVPWGDVAGNLLQGRESAGPARIRCGKGRGMKGVSHITDLPGGLFPSSIPCPAIRCPLMILFAPADTGAF